MNLFVRRANVQMKYSMKSHVLNRIRCQSTPVHVVQTSLGGMGEKRELLRHLGLRFGDVSGELHSSSKDFKESHFGPDEGSFQEGFLKYGDGMVAESKYLEITAAGSTEKTPEQCIDWCRTWADGRLFVGVGQNCWTMVGDFLKEDPDCFLPDAVKFKEQQVNGVTKVLVDAAQKRADEEGVEIGAVMQEMMDNPRELVPQLVQQMSEDMLDQLEMPDQLEQIVKEGQALKDKMMSSSEDGEGVTKFKEHVQEKVKEYTGGGDA